MPELTNNGMQTVILGATKADGTPDIANVLFEFPVPHQQMSIRQTSKIDEVRIPGRSGKQKQAVGYEDTEITIDLLLVDIEDKHANVVRSALQQFEEIQAAFRDRSQAVTTAKATKGGSQPGTVPTVFSIRSPLTDACGIKTVVFNSIDVSDATGDTAVHVSMSLTEFEPTTRKAEGRKKKKISELDQYMSDMAYYDYLESLDALDNSFVGPLQTPRESASDVAAAIANDAAAKTVHENAVGKEDPLAAAFRQGKEKAMGRGTDAGKL